jgi:hypothetical protein
MSMPEIAYTDIVDKSTWARGPWDNEPDKMQWQDRETGLPCVILRNRIGSWFGYVGVLPGHPLHGVEYGQCPQRCGEDWCEHRPEEILEAHGGIKFTAGRADISQEAWERWRAELLAREEEAKKYPQGEAAELLQEWREALEDYEAWKLGMQQCRVCHVPGEGESDDVWWFGFDCADMGDLCPQMSTWGAPRLKAVLSETYKDVAFVKAECTKLAKQLRAIEAAPAARKMEDPS